MTPSEFREVARAWCARFGGSETSGQRTPLHNAKVGGVVGSAHLFGLAVDVVYDVPPPSILDRQRLAERLGLRVVAEDDHDHLQPLNWPAG